MNGRRILTASSVPLAAPWNGADKNFARLVAEFDRANSYIVQTGPTDEWPQDHVFPVRSRNPASMPTADQKARMAAYIARYARSADLLHVVASLNRPSRWAGDVLRLWRAVSGRPIVHTVPSIGDATPDPRHFAGDVTVVVSEHTRRLLMDAGVQNVVRVYPPLDGSRLRPTRDRVEQIRGELALGTRAVLYAAHYGPESGIKEVIEAFAHLQATLADAVLVLACRTRVGQDPQREAIQVQRWAAEAGIGDRVRVAGDVNDMPALIQACAVTALVPARLAGKMDLPLVVLEALALGRPVIVTDRTTKNDALLGEGGLSVEFGDVDALCGALGRLLIDAGLREQLGAQGRTAVLRQCDAARVAERYREFYELALAARSRAQGRGEGQVNDGG